MAAVMVAAGGVTVGGFITAVTKRVGVNSGIFDWATSDFAKSETMSPTKKRVDIKMEIFTIAGNFLNAFMGMIKRLYRDLLLVNASTLIQNLFLPQINIDS
jgi:hypothetical protein